MKTQIKILQFFSYVFPYWAAKKAAQLFLTPVKHKRPESEMAWYQSAQKQTVLDGVALYQWGDLSSDKKVLLVHGWEGRGTQMAAFMPALVDAGYCVYALDGQAHGDSLGQQLNAGLYARTLVQVANVIGPLESVIAHSFGAGCSVVACHMGMKVKKIVHIGGPQDYFDVINDFLNVVKISGFSRKLFIEILKRKAKIDINLIHIKKTGLSLKQNVLIVHDTLDKEVKYQHALALHEAWRGSQLLTTEGLGHRRILKDPDVVARVASFVMS